MGYRGQLTPAMLDAIAIAAAALASNTCQVDLPSWSLVFRRGVPAVLLIDRRLTQVDERRWRTVKAILADDDAPWWRTLDALDVGDVRIDGVKPQSGLRGVADGDGSMAWLELQCEARVPHSLPMLSAAFVRAGASLAVQDGGSLTAYGGSRTAGQGAVAGHPLGPKVACTPSIIDVLHEQGRCP